MTIRYCRYLLAGVALYAAAAQAQVISNLEWVPGTNPPVARVTFNGNVRYLRQAPASNVPADLAQVGFQLVTVEDSATVRGAEEGKRLAGGAGRPAVDLSYVAQPNASTRSLTLRFDTKVLVSAHQGPGARTIDLELAPAAVDARDKLPPMVDAVQDRNFAVVLQTYPNNGSALPRVPAEFQDYAAFSRAAQGVSPSSSELVLGYFKEAADAEKVRQRALASFPRAQVVRLTPAPAATAATPTPAASPTPAPSPAAAVAAAPAAVVAAAAVAPVAPAVDAPAAPRDNTSVPAQAQALVDKARAAMDKRDYRAAIEPLNQALMLPPNPSSPVAQEMIGTAWEGLNSPDKARIEYQLYQKLYPQGEAAQRVAQRLQALGDSTKAGASAATVKAPPSRLTATGSISQYYYGGQTKTDSLVNIAAGIDQSTLTRTNQSVLVSSWDATGRYLTDESETKLIMRGSHSDNLATSSSLSSTTQGLISAAYLDYRDLPSRIDFRLGRQSAIGGSMFGLFDGISVAMPISEKFKIDAMLGVPANQLVSAQQQTLSGVMIEADNLFTHWGGNISLTHQTTEEISDKRMLGTEVRYFGDSLSMYTQLEYELNMNTLNAATLQGSFQGPMDTTVTVLVDDRKAPSLQLTDALISMGGTSLKTLLQLHSLSELQNAALATAAQARQAMVSVSRSFSPKWQGSMDLRYSEIGALPAVGNFQAMPATGAQYNISFQVTGSNLYSTRDINGFNVSFITSDTLNGTQFAFNNLTGIWDNQGSLEPSIRFYTQNDNTSTTVNRISPGLRISYKLSPRANVMGEAIYETSQTDGPANHETSSSMFFYVGYRYDFQ